MTVYTPKEDSFLLKEYVEELDLEGKNVLEIGTGSGLTAITAAVNGADVLATDINSEALKYAEKQAKEKEVSDRIKFLQSDLFDKISGKFDLILFNPPYLPGEEGIGDEDIWRGGDKGIEVTRRFLEAAPNFLSEEGVILVIISSRAEYKSLIEDYELEIIDSEKLWFETLYLARSK